MNFDQIRSRTIGAMTDRKTHAVKEAIRKVVDAIEERADDGYVTCEYPVDDIPEAIISAITKHLDTPGCTVSRYVHWIKTKSNNADIEDCEDVSERHVLLIKWGRFGDASEWINECGRRGPRDWV